MTIKEIAELCGVDKTTVYRWVEKDDFLSCEMQLRKSIIKKIKKGSPEKPSDFSLEETLAIIGDGGGNKTLAALLEENSRNKNALSIEARTGIVQTMSAFNSRLDRIEKTLARIEKGQNAQSGYAALPLPEDTHADILRFGGKFLEITGKDADFIEANVLFKLFFRHAMTVPINSKKFFEELSYIFPQLRLDSSRKYNPVFRGCIIK